MLIVCVCAWHMLVQVCLSIELLENPCLLPASSASLKSTRSRGWGTESSTQRNAFQQCKGLHLNFQNPANHLYLQYKKGFNIFLMFPKWPKEGERWVFPSQSPSSLIVAAKQAGPLAPASGEASSGSGARTPPAPQFSEDRPETARATASGGGREGRGRKTSGRL
jgi:hypothetical protein